MNWAEIGGSDDDERSLTPPRLGGPSVKSGSLEQAKTMPKPVVTKETAPTSSTAPAASSSSSGIGRYDNQQRG